MKKTVRLVGHIGLFLFLWMTLLSIPMLAIPYDPYVAMQQPTLVEFFIIFFFQTSILVAITIITALAHLGCIYLYRFIRRTLK